MIERPPDKQGDRYEYFTCSGRRKKNGWTRSAIVAQPIENRIETTYDSNGLARGEADRVRAVLHQVFDQLEASSDDERALLNAQCDKLRRQSCRADADNVAASSTRSGGDASFDGFARNLSTSGMENHAWLLRLA